MTDQASLLQRLILAGEAALAQRSVGSRDYAAGLAQDVANAVLKPAPDGRVVHPYTEMLAAAVAEAEGRRHHDSAGSYHRVIGVLLPDVRADFGRAIEMRRRPTP